MKTMHSSYIDLVETFPQPGGPGARWSIGSFSIGLVVPGGFIRPLGDVERGGRSDEIRACYPALFCLVKPLACLGDNQGLI